MRRIFFNGPKGPRWVVSPVPTLESPLAKPDRSSAEMYDDSLDRRRFFGALNQLRPRLEGLGVSVADVRQYYAKRFGVERMRLCSQREWAVAAAEVQAMCESRAIFTERVRAVYYDSGRV